MFETFSAHVVHLGGHGAGEIAKLFNNPLMMTNLANIAEALALASRAGVDPIPLVEVIRFGSGSSRALEQFPLRNSVSLDAMADQITPCWCSTWSCSRRR